MARVRDYFHLSLVQMARLYLTLLTEQLEKPRKLKQFDILEIPLNPLKYFSITYVKCFTILLRCLKLKWYK